MPRNQETVYCVADDFTELTDGAVTVITFQILAGRGAYIRFTADATKPAATLNGIYYPNGTGELQRQLSDLTHLADPVRVWAKFVNHTGEVYVDHP